MARTIGYFTQRVNQLTNGPPQAAYMPADLPPGVPVPATTATANARVTADVAEQLAAAGRPVSLPALEPQVDLRRSRPETMLKVLDVDGAVRRVRRRLDRDGAAVDVRRGAVRVGGASAGGGAAGRAGLRRGGRLPDGVPAAAAGRRGGGALRALRQLRGARFAAEVSATSLGAARGELGRPGVEVEPRRMWPTGLTAVGVELKGRITAGERRPPSGRPAVSPISPGETGCGRCSPRRARTDRFRTMSLPPW